MSTAGLYPTVVGLAHNLEMNNSRAGYQLINISINEIFRLLLTFCGIREIQNIPEEGIT